LAFYEIKSSEGRKIMIPLCGMHSTVTRFWEPIHPLLWLQPTIVRLTCGN
jgi:hypothetical protein